MKILMVNKFHYIKGGSETHYFALKRLLEEKGHTVIDFSMADEKNFESPYSGYFVENVDYMGNAGLFAQLRMACKVVYSFEAKKKFEALVKKEKPDAVHLHLFQHQISPSILDVIKKYDLPTVYTVHDLKMICPNYKMMHHGIVCEECKGGKYINCVKNRCVKNSLSKSWVNTIECYFHALKKSYDVIDVIVTPSDFYMKKFEEFGVNTKKLIHIPNFIDTKTPVVKKSFDNKKYYLYFGRLSEEKGIFTMIDAFAGNDWQLYIVGGGPMEGKIRKHIEDRELFNIRLLGFKAGQELVDIVGNCKAIILPSEWYENGPCSAIEALQLGRPVIGAGIGGIPELIDGNGFLFESANADDLRRVIGKFEELNGEEYSAMEKASVEIFERNHTAERHYEKLKEAYMRTGIEI